MSYSQQVTKAETDLLHILRAQLESEDVTIANDSLLADGLRNRHISLQTATKHHTLIREVYVKMNRSELTC